LQSLIFAKLKLDLKILSPEEVISERDAEDAT